MTAIVGAWLWIHEYVRARYAYWMVVVVWCSKNSAGQLSNKGGFKIRAGS